MKPSGNADRVFLLHIRDAVYSSVGRSEFLAKPHWQDAVIRQLEIVGEASKRLSEELNPSVPHDTLSAGVTSDRPPRKTYNRNVISFHRPFVLLLAVGASSNRTGLMNSC